MNNQAVIVLDMLNDFVTGSLKCERAQHIIPNLKKLIAAACKSNVPVIFSNDAPYQLMKKSSRDGKPRSERNQRS